MRRRASFSFVLLVALVLCAACPSQVVPPPSATQGFVPTQNVPTQSVTQTAGAGQVCEFFGARFVVQRGWKVEEHRVATEPLSRVSLDGIVGTHRVLVSLIPRELRGPAEPTAAGQAEQYFRGLRSSMTDWTEVSESRFVSPARPYPVTFGRRLVRGPLPALDTEQHDTVLLYFPDDFPSGRHFYVFFWTDVHVVGERPGDHAELRRLVDGFEIRSSPAGAASRGCS